MPRPKKTKTAEDGTTLVKAAPKKSAAPKPKAARAAKTRSDDSEENLDEGLREQGEAAESEKHEDGGASNADRDDDGDVVEASAEIVDEDIDVSAPVGKVRIDPDDRGLAKFDVMTAYQREIQRHPLLSPEETHALAVKFVTSQDPTAAAKLVTANLRLVVKIAYEYRRAYRNIMDLVQEGNIGLMQAVKRYDPYRGVKLSSYAAYWIRAYILRFILNNWRLVKLGTTQAQRKLFFNLRKKRAELVALGIDPTNAEIAKQLNVGEQEVAEMDVRLASSEKSLDAPVGDSDGRSIAKVDLMPSAGMGPDSIVENEEIHALLTDKLSVFRKTLLEKEKELAIFDMRLVADEPLTLQELGDKFHISRERVRQLEQRLTGRLREFLKAEMGDAATLEA
ncbi:MAG: RNA polymerase factor sigma-32 [Polyangiaceae bacterium]